MQTNENKCSYVINIHPPASKNEPALAIPFLSFQNCIILLILAVTKIHLKKNICRRANYQFIESKGRLTVKPEMGKVQLSLRKDRNKRIDCFWYPCHLLSVLGLTFSHCTLSCSMWQETWVPTVPVFYILEIP